MELCTSRHFRGNRKETRKLQPSRLSYFVFEVLQAFVFFSLCNICNSLQETQEYTRNVVRYCLEALQDWFDAINFVDEVGISCIFHLMLTIVSYHIMLSYNFGIKCTDFFSLAYISWLPVHIWYFFCSVQNFLPS